MRASDLTNLDDINRFLLTPLTKYDIPAVNPEIPEVEDKKIYYDHAYKSLFILMQSSGLGFLTQMNFNGIFCFNIKPELGIVIPKATEQTEDEFSTDENPSNEQLKTKAATFTNAISEKQKEITKQNADESEADYYKRISQPLIELKILLEKSKEHKRILGNRITLNIALDIKDTLESADDNLNNKIEELQKFIDSHEIALAEYQLKQFNFSIKAFIYLYISHLQGNESISNDRYTYTVSIELPKLPSIANSLENSPEYASLKDTIEKYSAHIKDQYLKTIINTSKLNPLVILSIAMAIITLASSSLFGRLFYCIGGLGILKGRAHLKSLFTDINIFPNCIPTNRVNKGIFIAGAILGGLIGITLAISLAPIVFLAALVCLAFKSFFAKKYDTLCSSSKTDLLNNTEKQGKQLASPKDANSFFTSYKRLLLGFLKGIKETQENEENEENQENKEKQKKYSLSYLPIDLITDTLGWDSWRFANMGFFSRTLMAKTFSRVTTGISNRVGLQEAPSLPAEVQRLIPITSKNKSEPQTSSTPAP